MYKNIIFAQNRPYFQRT